MKITSGVSKSRERQKCRDVQSVLPMYSFQAKRLNQVELPLNKVLQHDRSVAHRKQTT